MDTLWTILRNTRTAIRLTSDTIHFCYMKNSGETLINKLPETSSTGDFMVCLSSDNTPSNIKCAIFILENLHTISIKERGDLSDSAIQFLIKYIPYSFSSVFAKKLGRAVSVAHFAQSLDGKIATNTGHSKWIGNDENLKHAHRMRALCDGVLVGNHTLKIDKPKLNVRIVEGDNPQRVVVGASWKDFSSLTNTSPDQIIVFGHEPSSMNGQIDYIHVNTPNKHIPTEKILKHLYDKGIYSVYIEGGAYTTSQFLKEGGIDILQLHIAPLLFGSGKSGVVLPEIAEVGNCISFENFTFHTVGDTIMFTGQPKKQK